MYYNRHSLANRAHRTVAYDAFVQCRHIHPQGSIGRDQLQRVGAEAARACRFNQRIMTFGRSVQYWLALQAAQTAARKCGKSVGQRADQGGVVSLVAAAGERAVSVQGIAAEAIGECTNQLLFDLAREGAVAPRGKLHVERRYECIGSDAHGCRGRIEQPKAAPMAGVHLLFAQPTHGDTDGREWLQRLHERQSARSARIASGDTSGAIGSWSLSAM